MILSQLLWMLLFQVSGLPIDYAHIFFLQVLLPATSIIPSPDNDAPYAGTTLTLSCNYSQPFIETGVTWMVNGRAVDTTSDRISIEGDTLTFSPLATSDTGRYTCELGVPDDLRNITILETPLPKNIIVQSKRNYVYQYTCVFFLFFQSRSLWLSPLQTALVLCMLVLVSHLHVLWHCTLMWTVMLVSAWYGVVQVQAIGTHSLVSIYQEGVTLAISL